MGNRKDHLNKLTLGSPLYHWMAGAFYVENEALSFFSKMHTMTFKAERSAWVEAESAAFTLAIVPVSWASGLKSF